MPGYLGFEVCECCGELKGERNSYFPCHNPRRALNSSLIYRVSSVFNLNMQHERKQNNRKSYLSAQSKVSVLLALNYLIVDSIVVVCCHSVASCIHYSMWRLCSKVENDHQSSISCLSMVQLKLSPDSDLCKQDVQIKQIIYILCMDMHECSKY